MLPLSPGRSATRRGAPYLLGWPGDRADWCVTGTRQQSLAVSSLPLVTLLSVGWVATLPAVEQEAEGQDQDEQHEGHRSGVAELGVLERRPVDQHRRYQASTIGAAG